MPEFQLDLGERAEEFECLPAFVRGYIEALFFTESGEDNLGDAGFADLAPETLREIVRDYHAFTEAAVPLLGQAFERGYGHEQAGRDLWFTRNSHGAGFWDREVLREAELGSRLADLVGFRTAFPEVNAYRGDDGKVYLS